MKKGVLLVITLGVTCVTFAAARAVSPWTGSNVSFGFNANTGNTNNMSVNSAVKVVYEKGRWLNNGQATLGYGQDDKTVTQRKYLVQDQIDYAFNLPRTAFVFLNGLTILDSFSAYNYQGVVSAGYGHDLIRNPRWLWTVQVGPGFRRNEVKTTAEKQDNGIISSQMVLTWNASETFQLTETVLADFSHNYNYYQTQTQLTNMLIDNLALKITFMAEHYTALPRDSDDTKLTDTATLVSLLYSF